MTPLPRLATFLSGYLHQDWDLEYTDVRSAAMEFVSREAAEDVVGALGELAMVNAAGLDAAAIEDILRHAGCYYRPTDVTAAAWLVSLEQDIGAALWTRVSLT